MDEASTQEVRRIIACDVGLKRIGVARLLEGIILPMPPILRQNRTQASNALSACIAHEEASIVAIGLPRIAHHDLIAIYRASTSTQYLCDITRLINAYEGNMEGAKRILHFVSLLTHSASIVFVNEDDSSIQALESLHHASSTKRAIYSKNGVLDSLAACEILRRYLVLYHCDT